MHSLTRVFAGAAVAVLTVAVGVAGGPAYAGSAAVAVPIVQGHPPIPVVLPTGDTVVLTGSEVTAVQPGAGRAGMVFRSYRQGGDTFVVPLDQAPAVSAGRVPARSFDVSRLLRVREGLAQPPAAGPAPVAAEAGPATPTYTVKLSFIGRDGKAATGYYDQLTSLAQGAVYSGTDPSGTVSIQVPKGKYLIEAGISGTGVYDFFSEPSVTVSGNVALTFDARLTKPLGFTVDQPGADGVATVTTAETTAGGAAVGSSIFSPLGALGVRPSQTSASGYTFTVQAHLGRPDGHGTYYGSPYQYHLQWSATGRIPATLARRFHDADLSTVDTVIAAQAPGSWNTKLYSATVEPPTIIVEHNTPGAQFYQDLYETDAAGDLNWDIAELPHPVATAGFAGTEQWNLGPFGPSFGSSPYLPQVWCTRSGDQLNFSIPQFSDQNPNHFGFSSTTAQTERLLLNGQPLNSQDAEFGIYTVPPITGTYQYTIDSKRDDSPFSTEVTSSWTFESGHAGSSPVPLQMAALRFAPALSQLNQAPSGVAFDVPLYLQAQFGMTLGQTARVTVQASYDDGATWTAAPVTGAGSQFTAILHHPAGAGFVSLRGTATDTQGNATSVTIIRAYQLQG